MPNVVKYNDVGFPTTGSLCGVTGLTVHSIDENTDTSSTVTVSTDTSITLKNVVRGNVMIVNGKKYTVTEGGMAGSTTIQVKVAGTFYGEVGDTVTFVNPYEDVKGERLATNGYYTGQHKGTPMQDAKVSGTQSANSVEASTVRYGTILGDAIDNVTFPGKQS